MALATRLEPNRAARHFFDALTREANGTAAEQAILAAYQPYFGVTDQPELQDARFKSMPSKAKAERLSSDLEKLASSHSATWLTRQLAQLEAGRVAIPTTPSHVDGAALARHCNRYLHAQRLMPFMVPGYESLIADFAKEPTRSALLSRIPRHPQHRGGAQPIQELPGFARTNTPAPASLSPTNPLQWQPREASGFDLPRGSGGRSSYREYQGQPVLVVFFLGFGCAHCVAQLADLDPKAGKFRDAGIEVVTIGTDDVNQVLAARQAADENGVDPLHFDVLCDPKGAVFKQWGAWDEFSQEALHGTFLVDAKGRILWQDISLRPFEESDWLLAECKRLLAAWN